MLRELKNTILILASLCFLQEMQAQAPGYMGKRITLGYGFYIDPAIAAAVSDFGTNVVNTQHELFCEIALKSRISIGASLRFYKSTYNNTGNVDMGYQIYGPGGSAYEGLKPSGQISIQAMNYALYFKFFKRNYVAPWGKYFILGLSVNSRDCTYDPNAMVVNYTIPGYSSNSGNYSYNYFGSTLQSYIYPDIMFGRGNSRIFWNRLVLDYGYNIQLIALTTGILDALDTYHPKPEDYVRVNSGLRVRGINRFNFFCKLAYLF